MMMQVETPRAWLEWAFCWGWRRMLPCTWALGHHWSRVRRPAVVQWDQRNRCCSEKPPAPFFLKRCSFLFYSILRQFYFRSRNVCRFSRKVAVAFVLLKSIFLIYRMRLLFRWTEKFTTMSFSRLKCGNTTITQRVTVKLLLIWCVPPPVLSLSLLYFWHRV
jgi:hypothetical protein